MESTLEPPARTQNQKPLGAHLVLAELEASPHPSGSPCPGPAAPAVQPSETRPRVSGAALGLPVLCRAGFAGQQCPGSFLQGRPWCEPHTLTPGGRRPRVSTAKGESARLPRLSQTTPSLSAARTAGQGGPWGEALCQPPPRPPSSRGLGFLRWHGGVRAQLRLLPGSEPRLSQAAQARGRFRPVSPGPPGDQCRRDEEADAAGGQAPAHFRVHAAGRLHLLDRLAAAQHRACAQGQGQPGRHHRPAARPDGAQGRERGQGRR